MSLAHKLYKLGKLISKDEIKDIIEVKDIKNIGDYVTLQIDFNNSNVTLKNTSLDSLKTMFTKKIGGSGEGIFYLYPNINYENKNLLKQFTTQILKTLENSIMKYANDENKKLTKPVLDYIKNYNKDILGLRKYEKGNYFLILTINGKTFYELMPEVWDNYYNNFVDAHLYDSKGNPKLKEEIDFITLQKTLCGYNPNVKFFTYDNYHNTFKPDIVNKLPMSKETAISIKKGWLYAITHLKFYHKGLEYIIIPSMVNFNEVVYKKLIKYLKSSNDIQTLASKEESFIRRLAKQIEDFSSQNIALDILFTEVNITNLSVKIFATLEDVLPSRIRNVVKTMQELDIIDSIKQEDKKKINLRDYFSRKELFAIAKKNKSAMQNTIVLEKIYLAKLLLGYEKISLKELLKKFEFEREYDYGHNKRLTENGIKEWIEYPNSFVKKENRVLDFLHAINAIKEQ